jgi:hypothetical protein
MSEKIICPYTAKVLENVSNEPGCWDSQKVGIFENDKQIGEYIRNYHGHATQTFCPFMQKDKWFALYSKFYTGTSVMELPSCKELASEPEDSFGFCPVDYYVPWMFDDQNEFWKEEHEVNGKKYPGHGDIAGTFGFVSGCIWGDDNGWKVEWLDLSKITEGILKREAKFGYLQLPRTLARLKDHIALDMGFERNQDTVEIARGMRFGLSSGKCWDEDAEEVKRLTKRLFSFEEWHKIPFIGQLYIRKPIKD